MTALVVLHEFGHYRAAIKNGVKVNEFAIGFGPRIAAWAINPDYIKAKKRNLDQSQETKKSQEAVKPKKWLKLSKAELTKSQDTLVFALNWIPLGGYCAMDGESDADTRKGTFGAASFWGKTKILFAGVAMNWLTAFVVLTILAWTGMPQFLENQFSLGSDTRYQYGTVEVVEVMENSPAEAAGFLKGDEIISITASTDIVCIQAPCPSSETVEIGTAYDVSNFNAAHAGKTVSYLVRRNKCGEIVEDVAECSTKSQTETLTTTLNPADADYALGIKMSQSGQTLSYSTWSAPLVGAGTTVQLTAETFKGIGNMVVDFFTGIARQFSPDDATREAGREALSSAGDSVSGPVGIIGVIFPAFTSAGATNLAFLAAVISVSLACMNVLPIPALDGGRWLLIALARLRGKKLTKEAEEKIVSRAFIILIALFILITVLDIMRLF